MPKFQKKNKSKDDDFYLEEEIEPASNFTPEKPKKSSTSKKRPLEGSPQKSPVKLSNSGGRPSKLNRPDFSQDTPMLEKACERLGTNYSTIAKELYSGSQPPVLSKDLQNFIQRTQPLKKIASERHAELKNLAKQQFDESRLLERKKMLETPEKKCSTSVSLKPILFSSETMYAYVYRHDLGIHVDIDIDYDNNQLVFHIESVPLLQCELDRLVIAQNCEPLDQFFDYSTTPQTQEIRITIPADAKIEEITRSDHDTVVGALVELNIPKKKQVNKLALKAKRFAHFSTYSHTTVPIQTRDIDDI